MSLSIIEPRRSLLQPILSCRDERRPSSPILLSREAISCSAGSMGFIIQSLPDAAETLRS